MPKLYHDNPPAKPALSKILEELESELMEQCASEILARKTLLSRAVRSTEAVMHQMYEAEIERLRSDGQAHDKVAAFTPGRTPCSKFAIPFTPKSKDKGNAILHPSGPPVTWDFPREAVLITPRSCRADGASKMYSTQRMCPDILSGRTRLSGLRAASTCVTSNSPLASGRNGTPIASIETRSFLINDVGVLNGKTKDKFQSLESDGVVTKDVVDFSSHDSPVRHLNIESLPQLPASSMHTKASSMHTKTDVAKQNSFTSDGVEGKGSIQDMANSNHRNLIIKATEAANPESEDFMFLPTWKQEDLSPLRPKHSLWELDSQASKDGDSGCNAPSQAVSTPTFGGSDSIASIGDDATLYITSDLEGCVHCQSLIMRPTSAKCIFWDSLKSLTVLYDLIFIPLSAFTLPEYTVLIINDAIVSGIWVLDIIVSFFRGYIDQHGVVQMEARKVAMKYFRTWFFFDSLVVAIDVSLLTMVQGVSMHGVMSLLPMIRLVRIMKLPTLLGMILEHIKLKTNTDKWTFVWRIVRLLCVFLVLNHFMACGWYAVGQLGQRSKGLTSIMDIFTLEEHWLDQHFDDSSDFGYRYATSFHWSLTQLTPASMEVTPTNSVERTYNVCIIVFGFLMFSTFVSVMTQSILMLQQASQTEKRSMRDLRRFVADNSLSAETIGKIMVLLHESKGSVRSKRLHEVDIEALKMLPHTLRQQIRFEMFRQTLQSHPLMDEIFVAQHTCFKSLCHNALSEKSVERGETLFSFGMQGIGMYFVIEGTLHYHIGFNQTIDEVVACNQGGDSRLCEGALWVQWPHRGRTVGERRSYVVLVEANQFGTVCSHSVLHGQLQLYAEMFAKLALRWHISAQDVKDTWCDDRNAKLLVAVSFNMAVWLPGEVQAHAFVGVAFAAWRDWTFQNQRKGLMRFLQRSTTSKSAISDASGTHAVPKPRRWRAKPRR